MLTHSYVAFVTIMIKFRLKNCLTNSILHIFTCKLFSDDLVNNGKNCLSKDYKITQLPFEQDYYTRIKKKSVTLTRARIHLTRKHM